MYLSQDWLTRQIQLLAVGIAQLVFGKGSIEYEITDLQNQNQTDLLHARLMELIAQGKLCGAEDLLFEQLDTGDKAHLTLAVDFYQHLNQLTDGELDAGRFSRPEIDSGLRDVMARFGLLLPGV